MSKQLNEPEAWREVARRIAEEEERRHFGLWGEIIWLFADACIDANTMERMRDRVIPRHASWGWDDTNNMEPEARILAALWLALEVEEEDA